MTDSSQPDHPTATAGAARQATVARPELPINSIQPGGGFCMRCELAWGHVRRWYLRTFRTRYVERMATLRQGTGGPYPIEILDPRDLKFYRNQGNISWDPADDPFTWRDRLPVVRVGLAEIAIIGGTFVGLAVLAAFLPWPWILVGVVPLVLFGFIVSFFRDPQRNVPSGDHLVVSPADGRVFSVEERPSAEPNGPPVIVIDIFLSVFNVHINRLPLAGTIQEITYRPGKFLNALRPEAARENESLEIAVQCSGSANRTFRVRQITGAIARRIVCWVRPGEHLSKGQQFGMIKLGSRTELTIPSEPGLTVETRVGDKVRAGTTLLARYAPTSPRTEEAGPTGGVAGP